MEQEHTLTAENVRDVICKCLFTHDEMPDAESPPDDAVLVEGIVCTYAFHPQRLEEHKSAIAAMLSELPDEFMTSGGGGWSFLQACVDRDGRHWGEHPAMGALFALGIGAGLARYLLPREFWAVMPGGVPYIVVDSAALSSAAVAKATGGGQ